MLIMSTDKVQLSPYNELRCELLFDIFTSEVEYCFDLNYRNDMTFKERIEGFKRYFEEMSQAPLEKFFEDYGEEYFGEDTLNKWHEMKSEYMRWFKVTFSFTGYEISAEVENHKHSQTDEIYNKAIKELKKRGISVDSYEEVFVVDID